MFSRLGRQFPANVSPRSALYSALHDWRHHVRANRPFASCSTNVFPRHGCFPIGVPRRHSQGKAPIWTRHGARECASCAHPSIMPPGDWWAHSHADNAAMDMYGDVLTRRPGSAFRSPPGMKFTSAKTAAYVCTGCTPASGTHVLYDARARRRYRRIGGWISTSSDFCWFASSGPCHALRRPHS